MNIPIEAWERNRCITLRKGIEKDARETRSKKSSAVGLVINPDDLHLSLGIISNR